MVSGTGNNAQLDALQPDRRHMVGGVHYGGVNDRKDSFPRN